MTTETKTSRAPKSAYHGHNGFKQGFSGPEAINEQNIQNALQMHRRAEFFLEHQKREVPEFEDMQAEVERDDLESINKRIASLRAQHSDDLERLYSISSEEYRQEVMEQYMSRDYSAGYERTEGEKAAWQTALMELYDDSRNILQMEWQDTYEQIRHSYLSQRLSLEESKQHFEQEREEQRKLREQMFPQSKQDFESKPQDVRLRAARFLVADTVRQEKYLTDYNWAWRQVQPLMEIFKKDEAFAADIRSMIISEQSVRDPRKPRTTA